MSTQALIKGLTNGLTDSHPGSPNGPFRCFDDVLESVELSSSLTNQMMWEKSLEVHFRSRKKME